jgi:hypothetical protein
MVAGMALAQRDRQRHLLEGDRLPPSSNGP